MHGNPIGLLAVGSLVATLAEGTASAAILATYNFNSGSQNAVIGSSEVTATPFTAGPGLSVRDDGGSSPITNNPGFEQEFARVNSAFVYGASATPGSVTLAIQKEDYFSFMVAPTDGFQLDLQQISFQTNYYAVDADVSCHFFLRSSLDGFTGNIGDVIQQPMTTSSGSFTSRTIDLPSSFQNVGGEVEFRIYLYDSNSSGSRWLALDDVVIRGEAMAIPESSALLLLPAGLAAMARRKQRRSLSSTPEQYWVNALPTP